MEKKYWFKRKRYGYGWVPCTWQGWLVIIVNIGIILASTILLLPEDESELDGSELLIYFVVVFASTILTILVAVVKGPSARWRWGKSGDDNPDEDW